MTVTDKCPYCGEDFTYEPGAELTVDCQSCNKEIYLGPIRKNRTIGDYTILRTIGVGGMGEVFVARQNSMEREVGLKILRADLIDDQEYLDRFFQEVRSLAQVEHPNVVQAYETGTEGDVCYFSMEFVPGKDLEYYLDGGKIFREVRGLQIVRDVADALRYAWKKHRLIHRDIKPSNIMLTPDAEVKLLDLGISKSLSEDNNITVNGVMVGSPNYISPEQAKSESSIDFRADMYSLGATYYNMLTGKTPFSGENAIEVLSHQLSSPIPDPRDINPNVSELSTRLIRKMMAKDKNDRFKSWEEALESIDGIIEHLSDSPAPVKTKSQPVKEGDGLLSSLKNRPKLTTGIICGAICLAALIGIIGKSMSGNLSTELSKKYSEAIRFAEKCSPGQRQEAMRKLQTVITSGNREFAPQAEEMLEKLRRQIIEEKSLAEEKKVRKAIKYLKMKSYALEKEKRFSQAMEIWQRYAKEGEMRDNPLLKKAIKSNLEYLKTRSKEKSYGYD